MMFSVEEITLLKMYSGLKAERLSSMGGLKAVLPYFTEQEQDEKELTVGVIRKLTALNDTGFEAIDFSLALEVSEV